jgi:hypothetical protein
MYRIVFELDFTDGIWWCWDREFDWNSVVA